LLNPSLLPGRAWLWLVLCLIIPAIIAFMAFPCQAQTPMTLDQVEGVIKSMQKAHDGISDYVTVLHQKQRFGDELSPEERILLKFKKPFSVYMKWLDGKDQGREIIFIEGANDGKMWIHNGSFPDITFCLAPETCKSLSNGRHTVQEAGFGYIADRIARDIARAKSRPLDKVSCWDYGQRQVLGEPSRCFELVTPPRKESGYYGHRAYICQSMRTGLLNKITVWDFRKLLVEDFGFEKTKVNVGLTEKDFDPDNPDYGF
jgi:outer membrane lipoprotein-sorting protein